ncbi:MAG: LCP family protein required for cell wall assembly [Candidatus Aldehydirespiratoraceae bacterium]|jgi:LCP family protein required for cell wall assembly
MQMSGAQSDPRSFHVPAADAAPPLPTPPVQSPRARKKHRRWPWILGVLLLVALLPLYTFASAWWTWGGVERVDLSATLMGSQTATNYLVVGTDSREGVDIETENAGVIFGVEGERTDTIAVLRVDGDEVSLLAIPRDLYVNVNGSPSRINAAFARGGPELLVQTVQNEIGIGIDHYLEVDFAGFLSLVDSLGGVTVNFPYPAHDPKSGLNIAEAGPQVLDAGQALAYVRSRSYTEIIDGVDQRDPTADLGRVQRQQKFLAAVFAELGNTRNPFTLLGALDGVASNVRVDESLGLSTVISLGLTIRGADPATATLPTTRFFTPGGADVLLLDEPAASPLIDQFR